LERYASYQKQIKTKKTNKNKKNKKQIKTIFYLRTPVLPKLVLRKAVFICFFVFICFLKDRLRLEY